MIKPIVRYTSVKEPIEVGSGAWLWPIDHPSWLVSNKKEVLTSPVVKIEDGGRFETENTIYVPESVK